MGATCTTNDSDYHTNCSICVVIFIADTKPRGCRSLEVVKRLIADSGACNVHDQRFMLPRQKLDQLDKATDCKDLWGVMQQV